jgi:hypothetical protein
MTSTHFNVSVKMLSMQTCRDHDNDLKPAVSMLFNEPTRTHVFSGFGTDRDGLNIFEKLSEAVNHVVHSDYRKHFFLAYKVFEMRFADVFSPECANYMHELFC